MGVGVRSRGDAGDGSAPRTAARRRDRSHIGASTFIHSHQHTNSITPSTRHSHGLTKQISFTTHQHAKVTPSTRHSHLAQNTSTPTRKQSLFIHCGDLSSTDLSSVSYMYMYLGPSPRVSSTWCRIIPTFMSLACVTPTKSSCVMPGFPRARAAACVHGFYSHL